MRAGRPFRRPPPCRPRRPLRRPLRQFLLPLRPRLEYRPWAEAQACLPLPRPSAPPPGLAGPAAGQLDDDTPPWENPPPVEYAPEIPQSGPDPDRSESSLDWRSIIAGAGLTGPLRNLAASAQVLELTRSHVRLRLRVAAFATETGRELLSRALSSYFGSHCMVEFEVGDVAGGTVADQEEREREEAAGPLIEGFRNDPS